MVTSKSADRDRRRFIAAIAASMAGSSFPELLTAQNNSQYGIVGQSAPELSLDYWIDKNGDPASFSVLNSRGKWVLLKCFQDWCPGCHSSGFPTLKAFADAFRDHPSVAIAGIQTVFEGFTANTMDDVRKLQLQYALPIIMGHDAGDPNGDHRPQTMVNYRTGGTPWIILIDPEGVVVFNHFHVNTEKLIAYVAEQVS